MNIFSSKSNGGLKILALILAVVIYFAMKDALRDRPSFILKGNLTDEAAR